MAISTTRAKQIRKNFRKNYGPKPKVTTADVKGRRRAVKAGQTTYMKKDGTTGQLTRKQTLRTKQKLNQTAKAKRAGKTKPPRIGAFPGEIIGPVMPMPPGEARRIAKGAKKMRDGIAKKKTQPGKRNPKLDGTFPVPVKKKMRGGGMAKMAKKKMMRGGSVQAKKMRGGGMAKMASKKKMMRGGMAKKK